MHLALTGGIRIADVFDTVEAVADAGIAALVMTYWNPVDQYGVDALRPRPRRGRRRGPDHPRPDPGGGRARGWRPPTQHGLDRVFLVAPVLAAERIEQITELCRGFVYAASLMGITGTRDAVSGDAAGLVARIREHTDLPVAVGLGVSNGAQAAEVAGFADGVIVGSAFVRRICRRRSTPADAVAAVRGPHRRPGRKVSAAARYQQQARSVNAGREWP